VNGHFFSGVVDYAALKDIVNQQLNLAVSQHQKQQNQKQENQEQQISRK
jgi:hypothetical protein